MARCQLLAATDWTAATLVDVLGRSLDVGPRSTVEVSHLDTFDWRVFRAGAALSLETEGSRRRLHWEPRDPASSYVLPIEREVRFFGDLPDGFLKSTLEPILEARALFSVGARRVARWPLRAIDVEGNTLTRLVLERSNVVDGSSTPAGEPITVVRVMDQPGHERVYDEVVKKLRSAGASEAPADHGLTTAAAAMGRVPGDYSSKIRIVLDTEERADTALRAILARLLATLRANVDGVLTDLDTEFLHDMRVATRRARSALAQIRGVLEGDAAAQFRGELKWLGSVTSLCRDLDVFLLEMDVFRRQIGDAGSDLDPLQRMLERDRRKALGKVHRALRSARFSRLIESWNALASSPPESGPEQPNAARPIVEVAGEGISKAYRRMVKRGSKLGDDPPPEMLHRLRIDGKKLRYLLEFFASLYEPKAIARLVKEFKRLQDVLGGFNDMTVQRARLTALADELTATGEARDETVQAVERLEAAMASRQEELYREIADTLAVFGSQSSQWRYGSMFPGGED